MGVHNGEIKIKITAPPVDGEANKELISFLSDNLDIPKRNLTIVKGDSGRHKVVDILGVDEAVIRRRLLK